MKRQDIHRLLARVGGVATLREVLRDPAVGAMTGTLDHLAAESPATREVAGSFARLWEELAAGKEPLLPDAWRSRLVSAVLDSENLFALKAERGEVSDALLAQASRDLQGLGMLFEIEAKDLVSLVERTLPDLEGTWDSWPRVPLPEGSEDSEDPAHDSTHLSSRRDVAEKLASGDWGGGAPLLAGYFARSGAGAMGRYRAFRWGDGTLAPIEDPDPVRLRDLIGYEAEREALLENTERLLGGRPSQHALLYGPPGTGKSSTVKAIANEYHGDGLRLIEVSKDDLPSLPRVLAALRPRGLRFLVFVDDLSFEESEVEYKSLKALLEGSAEAPPDNTRLYATSNRRNLIKETFSERESDDLHSHDTAREKLSLAARFGLRATFPAPDQRRYLQIVQGLARESGLPIEPEDLERRALAWERWSPDRSGRTARRLIDDLQAGSKGPESL